MPRSCRLSRACWISTATRIDAAARYAASPTMLSNAFSMIVLNSISRWGSRPAPPGRDPARLDKGRGRGIEEVGANGPITLRGGRAYKTARAFVWQSSPPRCRGAECSEGMTNRPDVRNETAHTGAIFSGEIRRIPLWTRMSLALIRMMLLSLPNPTRYFTAAGSRSR